MVSFQCHGCGDVVKKPKLDQHRGRCHTGFDCIDCHTTFNTPGDYKGHTQCISEAEKYQKTLYKGPKGAVAAPRNNYPPLPASTAPPPAQGWQQRGRGGFRGGGWGRARPSGTGANDTPLGTPLRNSPLPSPKPVLAEPVPAPAPVSAPVPVSSSPKNEKKRKHVDEIITTSNGISGDKKVKIDTTAETAAVDTSEIAKKKTKKSKSDADAKEKKEKKRKETQEVTGGIAGSGEEQLVEKVKKHKKQKHAEPEAEPGVEEPKKKSKSRRVKEDEVAGDNIAVVQQDGVGHVEPPIDGEPVLSEKEKRRKEKRERREKKHRSKLPEGAAELLVAA